MTMMTEKGIADPRLNFSRVKDLRVREKELKKIKDAAASAQTSRSPIVLLIHGQSGTGKSTLVNQFSQSAEPNEFFFVQGKYDQQDGGGVPYRAIIHALNDLCGQIENDDSSKAIIQEALSKEMGQADVHVLAYVLPRAVALCYSTASQAERQFNLERSSSRGNHSSSSSNCIGQSSHSESRRLRLHTHTVDLALKKVHLNLVLRKFLRTVCSSSLARPVVFFQDDLQWADAACLDLIKALIFDKEHDHDYDIGGMVFIGTFRDENEELCANRELTNFLFECQTKHAESVVDFPLKNFDFNMVNDYLSLLLRLDPSETHSLTTMVREKTDGNIYFLVQFLESLCSKGYVSYCLSEMKWIWDHNKIERENFVSDEVVALVIEKIRILPQNVQSVLQIASCLGSNFDLSALVVCVNALEISSPRVKIHELGAPIVADQGEGTRIEIIAILEEASALGLIVQAGDTGDIGKYKFFHDRVQQAAYSLASDEKEKKRLHLYIGSCLLRMTLASGEYADQVLVAVNQLNRAFDLVVDEKEKVRLAELNREAASIAMSKSAFFPALRYLNAGLQQLEDLDKWGREHYAFSLDMCNEVATMAYATGDFILCKQVVDEVAVKAKTPSECCRVNTTWVEALVANGKMDEALTFGIQALAHLGVRFPRRPNMIHAIISLLRTKAILAGKSDDYLVTTQSSMDRTKLDAMGIIGSLLDAAFLTRRVEYLILISMKAIQLSLKEGASIRSVAGYSVAGLIFATMGDFKNTIRMGNVSLKLAESYHVSGYDAHGCFLVYFFLFHWRRPLHEGMNPTLRAYEAAMDAGEIKNASWCATGYLALYLCSGLPLGPLLHDTAKYRQEMLDYNQILTYQILAPYQQCFANLMGMSASPVILEGEYIHLESFLSDVHEYLNSHALSSVYKCRLHLAYHFDDLDIAYKVSNILRGQVLEAEGPSIFLPGIIFLKGLTSLALARSTGKRKHKREGGRALKRLERWAKGGAVNCVHLLLIVKAESAAVKKGTRGEDVRAAFDLAIRVCGRSGFVPDKALACERAGVYHVVHGDEYNASFYLGQAVDLYSEWGALGKVEFLKKKFAVYLSVQSSSVDNSRSFHGPSTYVKGRSRHSESTTLKHHSDLR